MLLDYTTKFIQRILRLILYTLTYLKLGIGYNTFIVIIFMLVLHYIFYRGSISKD